MFEDTGSRGEIMLVDDESNNLKFLTTLLNREGYRVRPVLDGMTALSSAQHQVPDLILLDILMPGLNGYEVCQCLKAQENTRQIPVIFLSALPDIADKVKAFDVGGADYIVKPLQDQEVLARVKTQITISRLYRELHAAHAQLRRFGDTAFEGLLIYAPDGTIQEANQAAFKLFHCRREALIGRKLFEFIAPDARAWIASGICDQPREAEIIALDKTAVPVEIQFEAVQWNDAAAFVAAIRNIRWRKVLEAEKYALQLAQADRDHFGRLVGSSLAMHKVYARLTQAAATDETIMISGETGTGKELAAHTLCELSQTHTRAFVAVNCGALQEPLFESQFFGYRKGAFTGADRDTVGYIEQATGGTLFLDEVEELTLFLCL